MLYLTEEKPYELMEWARQRVGMGDDAHWPKDTKAYGIRDDANADEIRAVFLFNQFTTHDCAMHIASDHTRRWATPRTLTAMSSLPFILWKLPRVTVEISVNNIKAQLTCLKVGFQFEGRKRGGMDDGSDAIVMSMLAQECRWIKRNEE